jgi:hypothetical protein
MTSFGMAFLAAPFMTPLAEREQDIYQKQNTLNPITAQE